MTSRGRKRGKERIRGEVGGGGQVVEEEDVGVRVRREEGYGRKERNLEKEERNLTLEDAWGWRSEGLNNDFLELG